MCGCIWMSTGRTAFYAKVKVILDSQALSWRNQDPQPRSSFKDRTLLWAHSKQMLWHWTHVHAHIVSQREVDVHVLLALAVADVHLGLHRKDVRLPSGVSLLHDSKTIFIPLHLWCNMHRVAYIIQGSLKTNVDGNSVANFTLSENAGKALWLANEIRHKPKIPTQSAFRM